MVGLLAATLLMAASAPQLLAVLRGDGHGVSLFSWILFLTSGTVWLVFGIQLDSLALILGNVAGVLAYMLLVGAIIWKRRRRVWLSALVVPAVVAVAAVAYVAPAELVGWVGVVIGVVLAVPQLVSSIHNWRHREPSDVSLWTWGMVLVGQALWLSYGVMLGEPTVIVVNVLSASAGVGVVVFEIRNRHSLAVTPRTAAPELLIGGS